MTRPTSKVETPWGPAQEQVTIADGIVRYHTASHGGIFVSPERMADAPDWFRTFAPIAGPHWFEQHIEAYLVALAYSEFFDDEELQRAENAVRVSHPDLFMAYKKFSTRVPKVGELWSRGPHISAHGFQTFIRAGSVSIRVVADPVDMGDSQAYRSAFLAHERVTTMVELAPLLIQFARSFVEHDVRVTPGESPESYLQRVTQTLSNLHDEAARLLSRVQ